jgi:hypothetical protein
LNLLVLSFYLLLMTVGTVAPGFMNGLRIVDSLPALMCFSLLSIPAGILIMVFSLLNRTRRSLILGLLNGACALSLGAWIVCVICTIA